MPDPFRSHLQSAASLVTPYEQVRAGFVALALEKNRKATPYVEEAKALKTLASQVKNPADLLKLAEIRPAILTAAGVSDKAAGHLTDDDKTNAIRGLIENFLEPAGQDFIDELVYRFLLTRGDSLGGEDAEHRRLIGRT
jgi:type II restriction enzyme